MIMSAQLKIISKIHCYLTVKEGTHSNILSYQFLDINLPIYKHFIK